jgi:hypothetical protein
MNRPLRRITPPTADELRASADPRSLDAALILHEHGISPYDIPMRDDALEPDGYLVATEINDEDEILAERRPWPDTEVWEALQPHLDQTRAYLGGRI